MPPAVARSCSDGFLCAFTALLVAPAGATATVDRTTRWKLPLASVEAMLVRLASRQRPDGSWEGDPGTTGLALRAFLSDGQTPREHPLLRATLVATEGWLPPRTGEADPREWAFGALMDWTRQGGRRYGDWAPAVQMAIVARLHFGEVTATGASARELGPDGVTAIAASVASLLRMHTHRMFGVPPRLVDER